MTYTTPGGGASVAALDMLKQPHLLIAGSTGSGKSVLINTLIYTLLYRTPAAAQMILIDSKRVELVDYARLPHTLSRATEPDEIGRAVAGAVSLMEYRFKVMEAGRLKKYPGGDVYVIVDELADVVTSCKRDVLADLKKIARLGRAARIHLILATQRPTKDIISGEIKVNIDARVALRVPTRQDSRNIINIAGAETLPRYGRGYYLTPDTLSPELITIPYTEPDALAERVNWWTAQIPKKRFKLFR